MGAKPFRYIYEEHRVEYPACFSFWHLRALGNEECHFFIFSYVLSKGLRPHAAGPLFFVEWWLRGEVVT